MATTIGTASDAQRPIDAESSDPNRDVELLQVIIGALQPVSREARVRILEAAASFLGLQRIAATSNGRPSVSGSTRTDQRRPSFSADLSMSPKEFMLEKQPRTDVERVACLAYYLTNYRDQPSFKTLDLSKLNTEAAQPKFANAAYSANNAVK